MSEPVSKGRVVVSSRLDASRGAVWARVSAMKGINEELRPWLSMTRPRSFENKTLEDAPLQQVAFQSWSLLLGFIPYDRRGLSLMSVTPRVGFVEHSESWIFKERRHARRIEPIQGGGTLLRDELTFVLGTPELTEIVAWMAEAVLLHRHKNLHKTFGGGFDDKLHTSPDKKRVPAKG